LARPSSWLVSPRRRCRVDWSSRWSSHRARDLEHGCSPEHQEHLRPHMLAERDPQRARATAMLERGSAVGAAVHGLVAAAALLAGLIVATEIEDPVKRT